MNDDELFKLCQKVYRTTKWKSEGLGSYHRTKDRSYEYDNGKPAYYLGLEDKSESFIPKYTSDFLLEKLPRAVGEYDVTLHYAFIGWTAQYTDGDYNGEPRLFGIGKTPLESLLRLTLKLREEGIKL